MHKGTYRLFVVGVLCVLLTVGTFFGYKLGENISREENVGNVDEISTNLPIIDTEVMAEKQDIKEDYIILKKVEYELCDHVSSTEDVIIASSLDEALENVDDEYTVVSKGTNGAVLSKKLSGYCSDHFLITVKDGSVIVYRRINEKEKEIYKNLEIPVNILRDDTISDLKKGIEVDSVDELNKIVEELES